MTEYDATCKSKLVIGLKDPTVAVQDPVSAATSPLDFLNQSVGQACTELIVIMEASSLKARNALVEMCGYVRTNPLSRNKPLLCMMPDYHRRLAEDLMRAKVEWTFALKGQGLSPADAVRRSADFRSADHHTGRLLDVLCPFIRYRPLDSRREMAVCGAYRDRMVLGRPRLESYCHRSDHLSCPFYMEPRLKQQSTSSGE